jgi:hypothetical protein
MGDTSEVNFNFWPIFRANNLHISEKQLPFILKGWYLRVKSL